MEVANHDDRTKLGVCGLVACHHLMGSAMLEACSCIWPPQLPVPSAASANSVFSGRVISITSVTKEDFGFQFNELQVRFQVSDVYKGNALDSEVVVTTSDGGASCGYSFAMGQSYLVYAFGEESDLRTGSCSRTQSLNTGISDISAILASTSSAPETPKIYFTTQDGQFIYQADKDGGGLKSIVDLSSSASSSRARQGISVFEWGMAWGAEDGIYMAGLDGSHVGRLIDLSAGRFGSKAGTPIGVLLADGGLYWTERDQFEIFAAAFGSSFDFARPEGPPIGNPEGLAALGSDLFWANGGEQAIYMAPRWSQPIKVVDLSTGDGNGVDYPLGIAVTASWLLWTDPVQDAIYTAKLDGADVVKLIGLDDVFGEADYAPTGIVVHGGRLFWADTDEEVGGVFSAALNGSDPKRLIDSSADQRPAWLTVYPPETTTPTFKVTEFERHSLGVELAWNSRPDYSYRIEHSRDLSPGSWKKLDLVKAKLLRTTWKRGFIADKSGFYRVRPE